MVVVGITSNASCGYQYFFPVIFPPLFYLGYYQGRATGGHRQTYAERTGSRVVEYHQGVFAWGTGKTLPPQLLQPDGPHRRQGLDGQPLPGEDTRKSESDFTTMHVTLC